MTMRTVMMKVTTAAMKTTVRTRVKLPCPICTRKILTTTKIFLVQIEQSYFTLILIAVFIAAIINIFITAHSNDLEFIP